MGSAVPVPAAVWLFGSALAGLGWLRRKQTF
ncbi:MAG: VPLPA-CTERM sorting domain-containing protein [Gammaproteobacteria bacterium]|nr:VPLPA-CTERM sorting domain-containing protein [Oceanicoccus sp.]MCP4091507.1 VPLPA-CTERM sorting domain-containing protein [Gammaproteobacteria bacterium]MCP4275417.1 VPLPA-CTERM sorting domain-containing protein [Gammaproteobacteria bacterium]MCP4832305.1 VPLPA-CTERM sorting domain-containing protein [Gammaproteobacteria bacterium]